MRTPWLTRQSVPPSPVGREKETRHPAEEFNWFLGSTVPNPNTITIRSLRNFERRAGLSFCGWFSAQPRPVSIHRCTITVGLGLNISSVSVLRKAMSARLSALDNGTPPSGCLARFGSSVALRFTPVL
jgi:hypothetical protein